MENTKIEIITFLDEKNSLESQLETLTYGSIEVRESGEKRYIYVHKRVDGIKRSSYVGEYSEELCNLLIKNNETAKTIKKRLRVLNKELVGLNFTQGTLSDAVMINVDYAKRNLVETIYRQAVLEGLAVTYLDTETIIDGGRINNLAADDVQKINNLKHAWQLVLNEGVLMSPTDFNLLLAVNRLVEEGFYYNAGAIRSVPVSIGGTNWKPPIPIVSDVKDELNRILNAQYDVYDKAISALLFVMRKQLFIDGNKRTAVIFANHILIKQGAGLIAIPDDKVSEYKKLLIAYYETADDNAIRAFIKTNCLTTL